ADRSRVSAILRPVLISLVEKLVDCYGSDINTDRVHMEGNDVHGCHAVGQGEQLNQGLNELRLVRYRHELDTERRPSGPKDLGQKNEDQRPNYRVHRNGLAVLGILSQTASLQLVENHFAVLFVASASRAPEVSTSVVCAEPSCRRSDAP